MWDAPHALPYKPRRMSVACCGTPISSFSPLAASRLHSPPTPPPRAFWWFEPVDGEVFSLDANDGQNCLHSGSAGFDKVMHCCIAPQATFSAEDLSDFVQIRILLFCFVSVGICLYPSHRVNLNIER